MTRTQLTTTITAVVILVTLLLLWAYRGNVEKDITVAIIAGSATILASVIVVSITQYTTKTAEVAAAHRLQKTEVYSEFGVLVFRIFEMLKIPARSDLPEKDKARLLREANSELQSQYSSFTKKLLLWGSSEVIHAWLSFMASSRAIDAQGDPGAATTRGLRNMLFMDDVFRTMRKDLELSNEGLTEGDLVKAFLTDPESLDSVIGTR